MNVAMGPSSPGGQPGQTTRPGQSGQSSWSGRAARTVTGLILGGAALACLFLGGIPFFILLTAVSLIAQLEFYQLFWKGGSRWGCKFVGLLCGAGVIAAASGVLPPALGGMLYAPAFPAAAALFAGFAFLLDYGSDNEDAKLGEYALLPMGVAYVPLVFSLAYGLGLTEMLLVVGAVVASDTAAYFAGSAFGKHKIWPTVSPKKSWEGAFAGFLAAVAVVFFVGWFAVHGGTLQSAAVMEGAETGALDTMRTYLPNPGALLYWLLVGSALAVAAQIGDFFESAIKRSANVKDSSPLLPGHGGFLDRVDSLLFALPVYLLMKTFLSAEICARFLALIGL